MTTTRKFSSTDASAPVLTGESGSLIALLNACLVGTAGVAYGSGGTAKTAAGWTAPFTNTATKGVWRNSLAAGGTGCYCRVLDDGTLAAGFREAGHITFASMSDIDTGTDPAPATATLATGTFIRKSTTADATARSWELVADEISWYLNIQGAAALGAETNLYGGGDVESFVPSDAYRYFNMGRSVGNTTAGVGWIASRLDAETPTSGGLYIGRNYGSSGTSIPIGIFGMFTSANNAIGGWAALVSPVLGTGNKYYAPAILVAEGAIRGLLRGIYCPVSNIGATGFATTETLPGGSGVVIAIIYSNGSQKGSLAIENALSW